jgi:hypothetical protein
LGALKCLGGFLQFRLRGFDAGLGFGDPGLHLIALLHNSVVSASALCTA